MVDKTTIHETIIRDIVDVASDAKRVTDGTLSGNRPSSRASFRSASQASQGLTMVFPLCVDKALSIETASMIAKAKERKCVTMLQMIFSAICISDSKNGFEHIAKVHKNLDTGRMTIDDFMIYMDNLVDEGAIKVIDQKKYQAVMEDFKNMDFTMPDPINENALSSYKVHHDANGLTVVNEYTPREFSRDMMNIVNNVRIAARPASNDNGYNASRNLMDAQLKSTQIWQNQLLPTDVKKANEIVPTMMIVRFVSSDPDSPDIPQEVIVGVKCKIYPIDTQDAINRIKLKNEDKNGILKFIKATTRETSFFKDFLFAIDKAKIDAISQSRRGSSSKLWRVLERRSTKSKFRRFFFMNNDASAITSLAISKETAEYLKKMENIDVKNPKVIMPIMDAYNLMSFVVVDESLEICDWLWDDNSGMYEQISFNALERETSDNSYKKVINLMTKMTR